MIQANKWLCFVNSTPSQSFKPQLLMFHSRFVW